MKITRQQLRKLIREAFKQKVPLFDPVTQGEIDALRQTGRQDADLSSLSPSSIPKLKALDQSGNPASVNQARHLYQTLGSTEPELSVEQEEEFFDKQDSMLLGMSEYNIKQAIEDLLINKNHNPTLLNQLGFTRVGNLQPGDPEYEAQDLNSRILGKPIKALAFMNRGESKFYDTIEKFLLKDRRVESTGPSLYNSTNNSYTELFTVGGQRIALIELFGGGRATLII